MAETSFYGTYGHRPAEKTQAAEGDTSHQIISSLFIGPKAENLDLFKKNIDVILSELQDARARYHPEDSTFITQELKDSVGFKDATNKLNTAVGMIARLLGQTSIPFWSPRYEAHMCTDMSMASLLGYFATMLYNPNNVTIEASPFTTVVEMEVGEQLCDLFGYNVKEHEHDKPTAWGHITCDGTVANLESMWVARNLKFYPLSLQQALQKDRPLAFIADSFEIQTCDGQRKLFVELDSWELLNLKSSEILIIAERLQEEYGISNKFLSDVMDDFGIQSVGKSVLEKEFDLIDAPPLYLVANTRHYSWPKAAAILGIGSQNLVGIHVDHAARVDLKILEETLERCLQKKQSVYAVVAIIGSTEEGAVDQLPEILAIRDRFQSRGLSFLVHADAAWGGYFTTMLPKDSPPRAGLNIPSEQAEVEGFVPDSSLRVATQEALFALREADSITVDPHKAGYIPYPAGGLCYRDGRLRHLVTWTSPYLSRGATTNMGIYGVEGSKPGASAVSTWLANKTIGLHPEGYGALQSEVTWTCGRLSAEWASLSDDQSSYICIPFNELPSETDPDTTPDKVAEEKAFIKDTIIEATNAAIVSNDHETDGKTLKLLRAIGSDLNINAFALNFRYSDGTINTDVEEANYLMKRVIQVFSVDSPTDDPASIPFFLTSTEFSDELYGECKAHFTERLQLEPTSRDLMVLRNVVMSPFPSDGGFIRHLAEIFDAQVKKEVIAVRKRNEITKDYHRFLMQGTDDVYLIHMPNFNVANHRQQTIFNVSLHGTSKMFYDLFRKAHPETSLILSSVEKIDLAELVSGSSNHFKAEIKAEESGLVIPNVSVEVLDTVVSRSLMSKYWTDSYPQGNIPFYLYGSADEAHIDHIITRAPNTQLSASSSVLKVDGLGAEHWKSAMVCHFDTCNELSMQPFPPNADIGVSHGSVNTDISKFFFRPGAKFNVSVYKDRARSEQGAANLSFSSEDFIGSGTLELGKNVYIDTEGINHDPFEQVDKVMEWKKELQKIGKEIDGCNHSRTHTHKDVRTQARNDAHNHTRAETGWNVRFGTHK